MDKVKCQFTWMVLKSTDKGYYPENNKFFSINPNSGFYKNVTDNNGFCYLAINLIPNSNFYHAINNIFKKELGIRLAEKKPPFSVFMAELNDNVRFSFTIRFSPPNIITILIKISEFSINIKKLHYFLLPSNFNIIFSPIYHFARWAIDIVLKGEIDKLNFSENLICRPFVQIVCPCDSNSLREHFKENINIYISSLVRSRNTNIGVDMIESIIQKNNFHNRKSLKELLLIDKQGVIYLIPSSVKEECEKTWHSLFVESFCLYEIAFIFRETMLFFLYPQNNNFLFHYFIFIVDKWINKSRLVFIKSVSYLAIWNLLVDEFKLKDIYLEIFDFIKDKDKERIFSVLHEEYFNFNYKEKIDFFCKKRDEEAHKKMPELKKIFISYSHADLEWLDRIKLHLKPLEKRGLIETWDDTKIVPGSLWKKEIEHALKKSKIAILLVSANFLASDFIIDNELPPLLSSAMKSGVSILPIILKPCLFNESPLAEFQAINPPSNPLISMDNYEQENMLVKVATTIINRLS